MARHDPEQRPPRPGSTDPRPDQHPNFQKPASKDYRNDARSDSLPAPSWDRSCQDPDRLRNDRRPVAASAREDARLVEIEDLQQKLQSLVAQLSNDSIRRHRANMAADDSAEL